MIGHTTEAIEELRLALETGYADLEFLQIDSDLDTLRDEPAFQALLSEYVDAL